MILSTAYLGNVQYYTKLLSGRAQIDLHEHYQKQSCRNRCDILSAGGPTTLVDPVCRPSGERVPVRDIRIDRTKKWRHQHVQALVSAYRRSPYFGYYEERFAVVYRKRHDFLVDLNEELQSLVLELLRAEPPVGHTERYAEHVPEGEDFAVASRASPGCRAPIPTSRRSLIIRCFRSGCRSSRTCRSSICFSARDPRPPARWPLRFRPPACIRRLLADGGRGAAGRPSVR